MRLYNVVGKGAGLPVGSACSVVNAASADAANGPALTQAMLRFLPCVFVVIRTVAIRRPDDVRSGVRVDKRAEYVRHYERRFMR